MIISKLKKLIAELRKNHDKQIQLLKELDWANVYHDSIRGKDWLQKLPLNIGRWAGNYSFFYVLNRILDTYKPEKILEFGLGESTKLISSYIKHELIESTHTVIEQNVDWSSVFKKNFALAERSNIIICPLIKTEIDSTEVNTYEDFEAKVDGEFDLYVIDGPHGSPTLSRIEILFLAEKFTQSSEFIIIFDDYNRFGEQNTAKKLFKILEDNGITYHKGVYLGAKRVLVIGSEKYRYIASL